MDNKRISEIVDEEMIKQDAQFGLIHYQPLEGMMSKEKCQTCGKDFEVNHEFFFNGLSFLFDRVLGQLHEV